LQGSYVTRRQVLRAATPHAAISGSAACGVAADGTSVADELKPSITWSDGQPVSADDLLFTWQRISDKEPGAITLGSYTSIDRVEAPDPNTVTITLREPTGRSFVPFVGYTGTIIPKHIMQEYVGAKAREAPILKDIKNGGKGNLVLYWKGTGPELGPGVEHRVRAQRHEVEGRRLRQAV
jgi:ABC-type transport system substrate-binding protein